MKTGNYTFWAIRLMLYSIVIYLVYWFKPFGSASALQLKIGIWTIWICSLGGIAMIGLHVYHQKERNGYFWLAFVGHIILFLVNLFVLIGGILWYDYQQGQMNL